MPLTEFLRMCKGKVDATPERATTSSDPSCRPDTDCAELVWENGQVVMQGQSSKARKSPVSENFQTFFQKSHDIRNGNGPKTAKFSTMYSVLADFPMPVSSSEMGLDQDVDMVPWLNYPIEDTLHNDYTSDFLHELSGVTINDLSTENHLTSREKRGSFHGDCQTSTIVNPVRHGNQAKVPSVSEKHVRGGSSEVLHFSQPFQHIVPRLDVSDTSGSNTGNVQHMTSGDCVYNPSSISAFTSLRLQKLSTGQPSTSSGVSNFSYFRPTAVVKATQPIVNASNKLEKDDKRCSLSTSSHVDSTVVNLSNSYSQKALLPQNQSVLAPIIVNSESSPAKPTEELLSSNQAAVCQEDVAKNDASEKIGYGATMAKAGMAAERNMEPVVATSSVCSGNSVERTSNEPSRDLKRKSRETGESEGPSDEVEDESVGARKAAPARGGAKRSRAAEVHNLSERRRRDRINEKMRALQELIPNCNKVDKASMLDEAIEYLKTLQLQVQMLSMGAGMYMQPMMIPPGMQPIHGANFPHFPPMGVGMGMGMGYGMNMLDVNSGLRAMPFQGPHYPVPGAGPTFQGMPASSLQAFGHPGQGLPMSMQRPPVLSGVGPMRIPMGPNVSGVSGSADAANLAPSSGLKDVGSQMMPSNNVNCSVNQASTQATNERIEHLASAHSQQPQAVGNSEDPQSANGTENMPS